MNKKVFKNLKQLLAEAIIMHETKQDYSSELINICGAIDKLIKNSTNITKDTWAIERVCLDFDKQTSLSDSVKKIDSRINGCNEALEEFKELETNTSAYISKCITKNPTAPNSKTTFLKEAVTNITYLGKQNSSSTRSQEIKNFYKTRQDSLRLSAKEFMKLKDLAFNNHYTCQKETTNTLENKKGLDR